MTKLQITMPDTTVHIMGLVGSVEDVAAQVIRIKAECPGATFVETEVEG